MRVTKLEINRNLLSDLERLNRNFVDVNRQLTSTKKLNSLSDSPIGSAYLVDITEQALRLDTYRFNITSAAYQLKSAESALNAVNNVFVSIHTLGMQAANETLTTDSRRAILNEIETLRDELISRANSQVDGRYIFAGTAVGQEPFGLDASNVLEYRGNREVHSFLVGDGVEVETNVNAEDYLLPALRAVDDLIINLKTAIDNGNAVGIDVALEDFAGALNQLGQARGQLGVNLSVTERMAAMIDTRDGVLREQRSNIEDANILEVVVRIEELRLAINAAMTGGGAILRQSNLFDVVG